MLVKEIMKNNLIKIKTINTVSEACRKMKRKNIGFLLCYNSKRKFTGIITDRDIVLYIAKGFDLDTKLYKIINKKVVYVFEDDDIGLAVTRFCKYQITRLPVLDRYKQVVGVLSISDLALCDATNDYIGHIMREIKTHRPPLHSREELFLDIDDYIL